MDHPERPPPLKAAQIGSSPLQDPGEGIKMNQIQVFQGLEVQRRLPSAGLWVIKRGKFSTKGPVTTFHQPGLSAQTGLTCDKSPFHLENPADGPCVAYFRFLS